MYVDSREKVTARYQVSSDDIDQTLLFYRISLHKMMWPFVLLYQNAHLHLVAASFRAYGSSIADFMSVYFGSTRRQVLARPRVLNVC